MAATKNPNRIRRLIAKTARKIRALTRLQTDRDYRLAAAQHGTGVDTEKIRRDQKATAHRIRNLQLLNRYRRRKVNKLSPRPAKREGLDYTSRAPELVARAGKKFAGRYLSEQDWKGIRKGEAQKLRGLGVAVGPLFRETTARRAADGYEAGVAEAKAAEKLRIKEGIPTHNTDGTPVAVCATVDFDARPEEVAPFLRGFKSVVGADRACVYGSYKVVKYAMQTLGYRYGCQTYAWSGGMWWVPAQTRQYKNLPEYDLELATHSDAGLWEVS